MATNRITKRSVDAAKPQARDAYLWDDDLSGFGLKVTPAGRKVYLVQYRIGGRKGRTRRVTIGSHGTVTPDQARVEAKRLLGQVASGQDPAAARREGKDRVQFGPLLDQFLTDHADAKLKPSSAGEYRRLARLYIPSFMRRKPVAEIQRAEVAKLHLALKDKPYQANRALALLSKFFNWCEKHGYRADGSNPCRHVEKYREHRRERFLSAQELAKLGEALAEAEKAKTASPFVIAAIRLLALTGARLSEILTLKWDHADFENAALRLPDSKTGQKSIYLNAPALEVLSSLPRLDGNPYVICGERHGAHLVNLQKPWRRIRAAAGLGDVRIHDLRHSFASVAAASGQSLYVIGSLLGHSQPQTTSRYAHLSADPLRAANEVVGQRIGLALKPKEATATEGTTSDVLLQRLGRLHRHRSGTIPTAIIIEPGRDLGIYISEKGLPHGTPEQGWPWVYRNLPSVRATMDWIREHEEIVVPRDSRELVELATHADRLRNDAMELGGRWERLWSALYSKGALNAATADAGVVDWQRPYRDALVLEAIATRLGEGTLSIAVDSLRSPFTGYPITAIPVPRRWLPDGDLPEVLRGAAVGDQIEIDGTALIYDRFGLRPA